MLDQRTIEILAQVVYKEKCQDKRNGLSDAEFWSKIQQDTVELARAIEMAAATLVLPPKPAPLAPPFGNELDKALSTPPQPTYVPNYGNFPAKEVGGKCPKCPAGVFVKSPKTGKIFCDQKCFAK